MKYYIDCEFDGLGGPLLSMALVSETDKRMYVVMGYAEVKDEWVREHVTPHMFDCPVETCYPCVLGASSYQLAEALDTFFRGDAHPHVVADWPDDIKYLCEHLITGPGTMINVPRFKFSIERVDAYPTTLEGAVQHNALWDALALRIYFIGPEYK